MYCMYLGPTLHGGLAYQAVLRPISSLASFSCGAFTTHLTIKLVSFTLHARLVIY